MESLITEDMCAESTNWKDVHAPRKCGNTHAFSKFSSCLDEVMHGASLDFPDEQTGSVEWTCHVSMVHVDGPHVANLDDAHVMVPSGSYLVYANDQGHVWVYRHNFRDEAERDFAAQDKAYGEWLDQDESEV